MRSSRSVTCQVASAKTAMLSSSKFLWFSASPRPVGKLGKKNPGTGFEPPPNGPPGSLSAVASLATATLLSCSCVSLAYNAPTTQSTAVPVDSSRASTLHELPSYSFSRNSTSALPIRSWSNNRFCVASMTPATALNVSVSEISCARLAIATVVSISFFSSRSWLNLFWLSGQNPVPGSKAGPPKPKVSTVSRSRCPRVRSHQYPGPGPSTSASTPATWRR